MRIVCRSMSRTFQYSSLEISANDVSVNSSTVPKGEEQCGGTVGLILMALSAVSFSIMSLFVHILASRKALPSFEQIGYRSITGVLLSFLWIVYFSRGESEADGVFRKILCKPKSRPILALRCVIGVVAMSCNWFTFTQLPLGDATVIVFTAPIFTAFVARYTLKESLSWSQVSLLTASTVGVTLVARPTFLGFQATHDEIAFATVSREVAMYASPLSFSLSRDIYVCIAPNFLTMNRPSPMSTTALLACLVPCARQSRTFL